ncbi:Uncharacterized protein OBRU01_10614 [Operophtera brumata]|uniref:EFHB C-terminal EF-hand domain-containing protein n=1 Tax=Operophtera brumata TaxID=104452 RepID=A0A0L7LDD8_OPEBR|nr:Uncharacterized protein OBRU01_10614 [Operophtera brumata]
MGGKGNKGMFTERDPKICAAGVPSSQPEIRFEDLSKHYGLQDEVDALVCDSIVPPPKPHILPPLRQRPPLDMRYAGPFSEATQLLNPPVKTKFQTLVEDFKDTTYTSYWKKPVGSLPDQVPTLPEGLDIGRTTTGMKTPYHGRLYDVVMPIHPVPDKTPAAKSPGYQKNRNYCRESYNPGIIFGQKTPADRRGRYVKCCLTNDRITLGKLNAPMLTRQADLQNNTKGRLGLPLAPNNNISNVPPGYSFGILSTPDNLPECLTTCEINPKRQHFKKCLSHLNTLRKCLKKRFEGTFFNGLYLSLKYYDKSKSGWLPKETVYKYCSTKYIRFDATLIEPILACWNAFDGRQIEYKTLVLMLNHTEPTPELPKVWDVPDDCIDFRTTYSEMVKPGQEIGSKSMAGLPSGRYFDMDYPVTPAGCCRADRSYLPEESDAKSCLLPSLFTNFGLSHRDMYATHPPEYIRNIFEAASKEKLSDEMFETIWREATNYHSRGRVCCETFRRALCKVNEHKLLTI